VLPGAADATLAAVEVCPTQTNVRRVFVGNATTPVTFWEQQSRRLDREA
jgi:hypothetical protein